VRYRVFGGTGLQVSELGFGCGSVGGLIIRGDQKTVVKAVARAMELGVNYFDTATFYGDGQSETNLGAALAELKANVLVGTKVMLTLPDLEHDIEGGMIASLEASLKRLRREYVDLFQIHNRIRLDRLYYRGDFSATVSDIKTAADVCRVLQQQGKIRFWGLNGVGDTEAILEAVRSIDAQTIQVCYNLLNPSAGMQVPPEFPFQDFQQLIDKAANRQVGVIAIRVLAAGALSGTTERHPLASGSFIPIASGRDYHEDVNRSSLFGFLVKDGYASSLIEAALRFVISKPETSTAVVGFSSLDQLEEAAKFIAEGPLPEEALNRIADVVACQPEVQGRED
jgi:aryl-alcohol dehydrogenase-like predicted oxidoreductase